jgi:hypothetical protein
MGKAQIIKIGADELILWMRKNKIAGTKDTDTVGREILAIITGLGGKKILDNEPAYWDAGGAAVHARGLPKTSAQYEIEAPRLPELYAALEIL